MDYIEFVRRHYQYSDGKEFKEGLWKLKYPPAVPYQVGPTCVFQVMANVLEYRYFIYYCRRNQLPPFGRLSVQYLIDRTQTWKYENDCASTRDKSIAAHIITNEGIMPAEHYCVPHGLRGEFNWLPLHRISHLAHHRCAAAYDEWLGMHDADMTADQKFNYIVDKLKDGPVYAEFYPVLSDYYSQDNTPHEFKNPQESELDKLPSHAIMLVGSGTYRIGIGPWVRYFIYLNTHSHSWGDNGFGRIIADDMEAFYSIWCPTVPWVDRTGGVPTSGGP